VPAAPVPEKVQKWRRWIEEDIRQDVVEMLFRRQIWRAVVEPLVHADPSGSGAVTQIDITP